MAKRTPPPERSTTPHLTQPAAVVRSKLEDRIAAGKDMIRQPATGPLEVRQLMAEHQKWTAYNLDLLRVLFSIEQVATDYRRSPPAPRAAFAPPTATDQ